MRIKNVLQYDRKKITPQQQKYIDDTVKKANKHGFRVHLIQKRYVSFGDNSKVNGYVSDDGNVLAVATARPVRQWFSTFVHESCHMDQAIENAQVWQNLKINNHHDATDIVFMWLDGVCELNKDQLNSYTHKAAMVELDCEKRASKKIVDYNFDYDISEYIRRANAYVFFYLMLRKTRKWYTIGKEPYSIKEIWSEMPNHFQNDYTRLPAKYRKLYEKYCYENK